MEILGGVFSEGGTDEIFEMFRASWSGGYCHHSFGGHNRRNKYGLWHSGSLDLQ